MMNKKPMMEDEKYKEFFQAALKKFKVSSPADFKSDEEKKKFFDYVDKNYKAKDEEVEEAFDPKKSLRHLATRGIGVFTKKEVVETLKTQSSFDYYDPNGDKKDGIIASYDNSGFVVKDTKTGKKYDFKYYTPGMRAESTTGLDEGVSPYRKTFIIHATEIANKLKKANPDAGEKDIMNALYMVMSNMTLPADNPNYKNTSRYMPDKFDKKLYDNGKGNTYDSEWMKLKDAQKETVWRAAVKSLGLKESVNIDSLMLRISESL